MGAKSTAITWIFVGVFLLCLLFFAFEFTAVNNATSLASDSRFSGISQSYSNVNSSLSGLQSSTQGIYDALSTDKPSITMVFLILPSLATAPFTLFGSVLGLFTSIGGFFANVFLSGEFAILLAVINAVVLIIVIIGIIELIRTGQGGR